MRAGVPRRIAVVAAVVVAALLAGAAPASAHTASGPRPTNFRSRVDSVRPATPGVNARVVDLGSRLEVTNSSDTEVVVLGYEGEQYLRIGPDGVFENVHSQATYLNRSRAGGSVPPGVDTGRGVAPEWRKVSSGHTARWHDHRIHWMGGQPPPAVTQAPGSFHHLVEQNVVLLRGDARVVIAVSLDWVPGPSPAPWIPAMVVLFAAGIVVALSPGRRRTLVALLAVLVVFDVAHAIGYEIPRPGAGASKVLQFFGASFVSVAVWLAAIPTAVALLRRRVEALYGVVFVGLLVGLIGGVSDLSSLWKSQLPDAGPPWLTRVEVVVAIALGAGLVVGALVRMVRTRSTPRAEGRGQWLSPLVSGLSDEDLDRIAGELDSDEVLEVAFAELARRAEPVAGAFAAGSLVFDVADRGDEAVWSVAAADAPGALRAARGRVEPVAHELGASFPVVLQLLAGVVDVGDAVARARVRSTGDASFLARVAPYLPEGAAVSPASERAASAP